MSCTVFQSPPEEWIINLKDVFSISLSSLYNGKHCSVVSLFSSIITIVQQREKWNLYILFFINRFQEDEIFITMINAFFFCSIFLYFFPIYSIFFCWKKIFFSVNYEISPNSPDGGSACLHKDLSFRTAPGSLVWMLVGAGGEGEVPTDWVSPVR